MQQTEKNKFVINNTTYIALYTTHQSLRHFSFSFNAQFADAYNRITFTITDAIRICGPFLYTLLPPRVYQSHSRTQWIRGALNFHLVDNQNIDFVGKQEKIIIYQLQIDALYLFSIIVYFYQRNRISKFYLYFAKHMAFFIITNKNFATTNGKRRIRVIL